MIPRYSHTQTSPLRFILVLPFAAVILIVALVSDAGLAVAGPVLIAGAIIALVVLVFSRLTVEVFDDHVRVAFGAGWPSKRIPLTDIVSAGAVRNRWWYGFGIRLVPGGWLWNVWGLDAVKLTLSSGKEVRIGTDEPEALLASLSGLVSLS